MNCQDARAAILEGETSGAISSHLAGCVACRRSIGAIESIRSDLTSESVWAEPPAGLGDDIVAAITGTERPPAVDAAPVSISSSKSWTTRSVVIMFGSVAAALVLLVGACSSAPIQTATSTTEMVSVPPQIADYDVQHVQVGDRRMLLAIADSPALRSQGLQGVSDLEDLDGMLFFWRHDGDSFWMEDTLIPLDVVWFNPDGTYKDRASMVPCTADPCPTYAPGDFDFRYAIEAPPGTLSWITESTVITYSD